MSARCLFALAVGAAVGVGAGAAEPKAGAPDLTALKSAVTAADKKGENVGAVQVALAAFEKALAKGAAKPGEAPPELTALRVAVEAAAKKGENVEAIAKELGRIESALTGREYMRPKSPEPEPEPEPVPPFPQRRPGGGFGGGRPVAKGNANGFNSLLMTASGDHFVIKASKGGVNYTITGQGKDAPQIVIKDSGKAIETDDIKKVPEEHRSAIEALLKMLSR